VLSNAAQVPRGSLLGGRAVRPRFLTYFETQPAAPPAPSTVGSPITTCLRTQGWLEVVPSEDARTQSFRLTTQGKRLLEQAAPAWKQAQQEAEQLLGEDGMALLGKLAGKLGMPMSER
jgi:hypothetical protein